METEKDEFAAIEERKKLPILQLGPARTYLYAYRISPFGIFFTEAKEDATSSEQVNFVTSGIILKAAGERFRDEEIGRLLAQNAIDNVLEVSSNGLVAC